LCIPDVLHFEGEVQVLASFTVGSILLGFSALTIALTLTAGAWLRECHDDLLEQHFSAVVDFRVRRYLQRRWRSRRSHGILPGPLALKLLVRITATGAFPMLASIPFLVVLAGIGMPVSRAAVRMMVVVGLTLAGVALVLFLRGMRCAAHPQLWGTLRRISFPAGVNARDRYRAVVNMYWSSKIPIGIAVGIAQVALITVALVVLASQGGPSIDPDDIGHLDSIVWIPLALTLPVPPLLIARVARRRMASASAIFEILRVLALRERRTIVLTPVRDPLWKERDGLGEIVALLHETARQLDARQRREMSPHPISDLLRAGAGDLHRFLKSGRSLAYGIPHDIRTTLILVLKVLVGPAREETYRQLNASVSAFDDAGDSVITPLPRKEQLAAAAYRVLNVLDQMSRIAPTMFWLLVLAALLIDGRASMDELLNILK
jgi:hypothetical protein